MGNRFWLCLCAILALVAAQPAEAQVLYGSIVGNVKDATEAVVSGATVTVTNARTNESRQTTTNDVGLYNLPSLQAGAYTVRISKDGFASFSQSEVVVTINTTARVDAALKIGAVAETVTVSADIATLQTDRSEVHQEIVSK